MSYMNVLRRREVMAAFILIAMFSFIVSFAAPNGGSDRHTSGEKDVVATTDDRNFTYDQIQQIAMGRVMLNHFRQGVADRAAIAAGQQRMQVGSYSTDDDVELVRSSLIAEEGRRMGIAIPDDQVDNYIRRISGNDMVTNEQLSEIVRGIRFKDRGVTFAQIKEAIRRELLVAETLERISPSGQYDLSATPEQRWEYFCRLERTMKLQAHAIPVANFLNDEKLNAVEPSASTLEAFYDEHKNIIPTRSSPEIGFKRPERVKLEYLKADWVKFYELAKSKLTEQEIRAEFDARKTQLRETLEIMENMLPPPDEAADKAKDDKTKDDKSKSEPAKDKADPATAEKSATDKKPADDKKPNVIKAPEPGPSPYEEATGMFATKAPKATEPRFTDDEVLSRNREAIVKALAERAARTQMTKSLELAHQRMIAFYEGSYRPWLAASKNAKEGDAKKPAPKFSIAQFASPDSGLMYHQTSDLNAEDLTEDKYFGATWVNRKWGKQVNQRTQVEEDQITAFGTRLVDYIFGNKNAYSPFRAEDEVKGSAGASYRNHYAMWVTEYKAEEVPEYADIRDEVKKAWKIANTTGVSARDLAMKRAQTIADDVNGGGKTLKEHFPSANDVIETEEFTWFEPRQAPTDLNTGPMHFDIPTFHRLDEFESVYFDFARAALRLKDKQAAAIMNDAGTIVYVVQVFDSPLSSEQNLRERFVREPFSRPMPYAQYLRVLPEQGYVIVSAYDMNRRKMKWWDGFEKQHKLDWVRPPHRGRDE